MVGGTRKKYERFEDMRYRVQRQKTCRKERIESNWACAIEDSIPHSLRPQLTTDNGCKALIGAPIKEAEWWRWSPRFLTSLRNLSALTVNMLAFAQEMMVVEVRKRQEQGVCNVSVAEILLSDLDRIVSQLRQSNVNYQDETEEDDFGDEAGSDAGGLNGDILPKVEPISPGPEDAQQIFAAERQSEVVISEHQEDAGQEAVTNDHVHSLISKGASHGVSRRKRLRLQARIASLRADAMRLRQEAARRDAEAYELEAKMLQSVSSEMLPEEVL